MSRPNPSRPRPFSQQEGFALIGLIVAIFIILLTLSVAAPTVARALRREREVEAVHRADEYVNAIRRYHLKTGAYPGSIEQLDKTNNIRYLRQKYPDPMTGKPDWRLIKVGENKTTVKGFFGQPLAGIANTGIGGSSAPSSIGNTSSNNSSQTGGLTGSSGITGNGGTGIAGSNSFSGSTGSDTTTGTNGSSSSPGSATGGAQSDSSGAGGLANQSGIGSPGTGAPFLGVGLPMDGEAIIVVNEKTTYPEWEFLYDPRIEQLRSKVNIFGGGMSSASSSSLGALSGSASSTTNTNPLPPPPP